MATALDMGRKVSWWSTPVAAINCTGNERELARGQVRGEVGARALPVAFVALGAAVHFEVIEHFEYGSILGASEAMKGKSCKRASMEGQ